MSKSDKMSPGSSANQAFADVKLTAHQLTLRGMRLPVAAHYVFNGLAALAMAMLGHPLIAAVAMISACGIDTLQQHLLRRWIREGAASDERKGAINLALLCVARVVAYTGPSFVMATGGGLAELAVFALQTATLIVVAMGVSATSPYAFWGLCTPLILECAALILFLFDPLAGGAAMLSLFTLSFIMILVAEGMSRTTSTWHAAQGEPGLKNAARPPASPLPRARPRHAGTRRIGAHHTRSQNGPRACRRGRYPGFPAQRRRRSPARA